MELRTKCPLCKDLHNNCFVEQTEGHEKWWDLIWAAQVQRGADVSTMIAEHGPPPYQQTCPKTHKPLCNIWEVNHWIQMRRQASFDKLFVGNKIYADFENSKLVADDTRLN